MKKPIEELIEDLKDSTFIDEIERAYREIYKEYNAMQSFDPRPLNSGLLKAHTLWEKLNKPKEEKYAKSRNKHN